MTKFLDKTFFRFLIGFLLILLASFIFLFVASSYKTNVDKESQFAKPQAQSQ